MMKSRHLFQLLLLIKLFGNMMATPSLQLSNIFYVAMSIVSMRHAPGNQRTLTLPQNPETLENNSMFSHGDALLWEVLSMVRSCNVDYRDLESCAGLMNDFATKGYDIPSSLAYTKWAEQTLQKIADLRTFLIYPIDIWRDVKDNSHVNLIMCTSVTKETQDDFITYISSISAMLKGGGYCSCYEVYYMGLIYAKMANNKGNPETKIEDVYKGVCGTTDRRTWKNESGHTVYIILRNMIKSPTDLITLFGSRNKKLVNCVTSDSCKECLVRLKPVVSKEYPMGEAIDYCDQLTEYDGFCPDFIFPYPLWQKKKENLHAFIPNVNFTTYSHMDTILDEYSKLLTATTGGISSDHCTFNILYWIGKIIVQRNTFDQENSSRPFYMDYKSHSETYTLLATLCVNEIIWTDDELKEMHKSGIMKLYTLENFNAFLQSSTDEFITDCRENNRLKDCTEALSRLTIESKYPMNEALQYCTWMKALEHGQDCYLENTTFYPHDVWSGLHSEGLISERSIYDEYPPQKFTEPNLLITILKEYFNYRNKDKSTPQCNLKSLQLLTQVCEKVSDQFYTGLPEIIPVYCKRFGTSDMTDENIKRLNSIAVHGGWESLKVFLDDVTLSSHEFPISKNSDEWFNIINDIGKRDGFKGEFATKLAVTLATLNINVSDLDDLLKIIENRFINHIGKTGERTMVTWENAKPVFDRFFYAEPAKPRKPMFDFLGEKGALSNFIKAIETLQDSYLN